MAFLSEWRLDRERRARTRVFVRTLYEEPAPADVEWLDVLATQHDADHARWEWRYARRALGLLVAGRDALDDRTASLVARELSESLARDPAIGPGMLPLAERQFNDRLRAYGDALATRPPDPSGRRLAAALLRFADVDQPGEADLARAAAVLSVYMLQANAALRSAFGAASLPEDVVPSTLAQSPRSR
jgi:hypothetical protein